MAIAYTVGAPYVFIFKHTGEILQAALLYIGLLGILWDGSLIILGLMFETWRHFVPFGKRIPITVESTRNVRFFTRGLLPLILIILTSFIIYGTGNITLTSLKLIGSTTEWRDSFFWAIEGPVIEWIAGLPINTGAWDKLYHSAWGIELFAAFVLIVSWKRFNDCSQILCIHDLAFLCRSLSRRYEPGYGTSISQTGTVQLP